MSGTFLTFLKKCPVVSSYSKILDKANKNLLREERIKKLQYKASLLDEKKIEELLDIIEGYLDEN